MLLSYPATYRDTFGEEETYIHNDGRHLWMSIRGVLFHSKMLDDWTPINKRQRNIFESFKMDRDESRKFALTFHAPIHVISHLQIISADLCIQIELGEATERGLITYERVQLSLRIDEISYQSRGSYGWFEDALNDLQVQLPKEVLIHTCINCAYSDYNPAGYGMFGCLACFRDCKDAYLSREGKAAFFDLKDAITELVQEIHICPEFEPRKPGTGYRG